MRKRTPTPIENPTTERDNHHLEIIYVRNRFKCAPDIMCEVNKFLSQPYIRSNRISVNKGEGSEWMRCRKESSSPRCQETEKIGVCEAT